MCLGQKLDGTMVYHLFTCFIFTMVNRGQVNGQKVDDDRNKGSGDSNPPLITVYIPIVNNLNNSRTTYNADAMF